MIEWVLLFIGVWATSLGPSVCKSRRRLDGMTVLVTGANTGLGKESVIDFAQRGARIYMACRDLTKAQEAMSDVLKICPEAKVHILKLDLASLESVKSCAEAFLKKEKQLDILMLNAGFGSSEHRLTADNIEWHLAINHLGHFYLTRLLLPLLKKTGTSEQRARIVVLSSAAHKMMCYGQINYEGLQTGAYPYRFTAYGQSKLANILFTRHLSKLLTTSHVTVNAVHPGTCMTEFLRHFMPGMWLTVCCWLVFPAYHLFLTAKEGAQTQIYVSVDESLEGVTGKYFEKCVISETSNRGKDMAEAEKLWNWSCEKTNLPIEI